MEKIKKSFLAEEVYKSIKEYLLGGRFVEGQKIKLEKQKRYYDLGVYGIYSC